MAPRFLHDHAIGLVARHARAIGETAAVDGFENLLLLANRAWLAVLIADERDLNRHTPPQPRQCLQRVGEAFLLAKRSRHENAQRLARRPRTWRERNQRKIDAEMV